jgi:hypothetical protein
VAEIEIHHGHESDDFGKKVGVCVGVIGIILAGITIESHRAHTNAVIYRTEANDQWAFYQSKKIRENAAEIAQTTLRLLASDPAKIEQATAKLEETRARYAVETDKIQEEAKAKEEETKHSEHQALQFDLGEGLLELGLVLSSLYFFSKRRLFPYIGISAATIGTIVGISGFFV